MGLICVEIFGYRDVRTRDYAIDLGIALQLTVPAIDFLLKEGYIEGFKTEDNNERPGRSLIIEMKYSPERARVISGLRRVSKPGLRVYSQSTKVPRVLGGLGVAVLSTSQGLMTDREARKRNVGGEVLCYVW